MHATMERLYKAAKELAKVTGKTNLALYLGQTPQTLNNWESRGISSAGLLSSAKKIGCNAAWLESGSGPMEAEKTNISAAQAQIGEVPVISWVQAGAWSEVSDLFQPGEAERFLPIFRGHSTNTFALRVRGDSMTSQHGRSYPAGCYIIVDPNKNSPVNGERIIAKLEGSDEATFKVYKNEDGRQWLQPLNPMHEPIREPFKVIGTVIGTWYDE